MFETRPRQALRLALAELIRGYMVPSDTLSLVERLELSQVSEGLPADVVPPQVAVSYVGRVGGAESAVEPTTLVQMRVLYYRSPYEAGIEETACLEALDALDQCIHSDPTLGGLVIDLDTYDEDVGVLEVEGQGDLNGAQVTLLYTAPAVLFGRQ